MRIQVEVPEEDAKELKALMEKLGMETYKELFSNALELLYWAAQEVREGQTIASVDASRTNYKMLAMPALNRLMRQRMAAIAGS